MRALEDTKEKLPADLLVLDSTFPSFRSIARAKISEIWFLWPFQPIAWSVVSDKYSGSSSVEKIKYPTLVIHEKGDPIVPFRYGREIFDRLKVKKKWFWPMEGKGHIATLGNPKKDTGKRLIKLIEEGEAN